MNKKIQIGTVMLAFIAVIVVLVSVRLKAPTADLTTQQAMNPTPTQGSGISPTEEPTEVINPIQETYAEDFVGIIEFDSTGERLLFTTDGLYPNSPAVFGLPFDNENGTVGTTATVVVGLPEGIALIDNMRVAQDRIVFLGTADGSDDLYMPLEQKETELYSVDLAGNNMITLTHGVYNPHDFMTRSDAESVIFADSSTLISVNATTGITTSLGDYGIINSLAQSATGAVVAVTHRDLGSTATTVSLVDEDGSNRRVLQEFPDDGHELTLSSVVISDHGDVYVVTSRKRSMLETAFDVHLMKGTITQAGMNNVMDITPITSASMRLTALQLHPNSQDLIFFHGGPLWMLNTTSMTISKISDPADMPSSFALTTGVNGHNWAAYVIREQMAYDPSKVTRSGAMHAEKTTIKIKVLQ